MNAVPRRIRRPLQFLFFCIVIPALHGVAIAPGSVDEAKAIAEIERLGGTVERDNQLPGHPVTRINLAQRPGELRSRTFEDQDVQLVRQFKDLTQLNLSDCHVTDRGLEALGGLKNLTELDLSFCFITDRGLKVLREFRKLTSLRLKSGGW